MSPRCLPHLSSFVLPVSAMDLTAQDFAPDHSERSPSVLPQVRTDILHTAPASFATNPPISWHAHFLPFVLSVAEPITGTVCVICFRSALLGSASHVDRRSIDSELYGVRTGMEVYTSALATQTIVFLCRERRTSTYTSTKGLETGRQRHRKVKSVVYSTYIHMNPMKESKVSRAVKNIIRQMVGIAVIEC